MPHLEVKDSAGNDIPSVTQVIGILGKQELYRWYGTRGFDECEQIKKEAGEWGTELHSSISQLLKGEEVQVTSRCAPMLDSFKRWLASNNFKPLVVEPEKPYVSAIWGYQGTFDAIGEMANELIVCDWKTSSKIYPENGLQLAAYANLWNEQNPKNKVKTGLIVRIDKKTAKVQAKGFYNLAAYFEVFKSLLPVYEFTKKKGRWA